MTSKPKKYEFVGLSSRSRSGCLNCKKKKKKCDEVKPRCGLCTASKALECVWGDRKSKGHGMDGSTRKVKSSSNQPLVVLRTPNSSTFESESPTTPLTPYKNFTDASHLSAEKSLAVTSRGCTINVCTEKEKTYLEKYLKVAETMSIIGTEGNCYLTIFFPLAKESECVLKALLLWGGMSMGGSNEIICRKVDLNVAISLIDRLTDSIHNSKFDNNRVRLSHCLAATLILLDAEVQSGDIKNWKLLYEKAFQILKSMGLYDDILDPIKVQAISPVERWLCINFLHHDILTSQVNVTGTAVPSSVGLQFKGCDTLEGCLKPCFSLLNEAINLRIEAKKSYKLLETPGKIQNHRTTQELNQLEAKISDLENKLIQTSPRPEDLLEIPKKYMELHLSLYELFQFSIQIYLRLAIRRYSPNVPEIQVFLYKNINLLIFLISSNVKSAMKFPFLIAGISCIHECDKVKIMNLLNEYERNLDHKNIGLIKKLIQEVWRLDPNGDLCLDWQDIASGFGWDLCLS
ncbi:transcriptional activator protein Uga3p [[Candida] railenensis]|uniref:Transcriptional activator protein Uga3p n=1 Tax=[Candida] railenensis TaxID=45579 RepID=A0A9P0VXE9_9ASCO|nr:transcriptional activator protein Uga3p [[Candida] railenensis]